MRKAMRLRRKRMPPREVERRSREAQKRIVALDEFRSARRVGLYLPVGKETRTDGVLAQCRRLGIRVCVPAYSPKRGCYAMAWFDEEMKLVPGWKGVPEPYPRRWVGRTRLDMIIVPGLAFDRMGRRLGQGGGHYDRLLKAAGRSAGLKVGIAFDRQIVPRVPTDKGDITMDLVATESRVIRVRRRPMRRLKKKGAR